MAGGMALRHSGQEMGGGLGQGITEIVDQVSYWFGPFEFLGVPDNIGQLFRPGGHGATDEDWTPCSTSPTSI